MKLALAAAALAATTMLAGGIAVAGTLSPIVSVLSGSQSQTLRNDVQALTVTFRGGYTVNCVSSQMQRDTQYTCDFAHGVRHPSWKAGLVTGVDTVVQTPPIVLEERFGRRVVGCVSDGGGYQTCDLNDYAGLDRR
jgi:hypothetical protein